MKMKTLPIGYPCNTIFQGPEPSNWPWCQFQGSFAPPPPPLSWVGWNWLMERNNMIFGCIGLACLLQKSHPCHEMFTGTSHDKNAIFAKCKLTYWTQISICSSPQALSNASMISKFRSSDHKEFRFRAPRTSKLVPRLVPFGSVWFRLDPFGPPFGSVWIRLVPCLVPFGSKHLDLFGSFWL